MLEYAASRGMNNMTCDAFISAFNRIDEDQSGAASVQELISGLKSIGFTTSAHDLRTTLKNSPLTSDNSSNAELSPFDFFLFLLDMAENKPSFFLGGKDDGDAANHEEPGPRKLQRSSLSSSQQPTQQPTQQPANDHIAISTISPSPSSLNPGSIQHPVVRDSATIERLKRERDELLRSTMELKKQIREETARRASASVDRPPPANSRSRNENNSFNPANRPPRPPAVNVELFNSGSSPLGSAL
jgi:hypothetical protein